MATALVLLAALPLLFAAGLWIRQERMIFLNDLRRIEAPEGWRAETLHAEDGVALRFLAAEGLPGAPVVLYLHGNGGNAQDRAMRLGPVLRRGYAVVVAGYRGYGGNPGDPGEDGFARDARAHLAWVQGRFPGAPVVLWGESLGTGVATRLAEGRDDIAALVLESPFTSVADMAQGMYPWLPTRMLLRHHFESLTRMGGVSAPVLVLGVEGDPITPIAHARQMLAAAQDGQGVFLLGAWHPAVLNDMTGEAMRRVLEFLADRVPRPG